MRWYFSFRSPYSYFAFLDLVEKYPRVADALEWIPYWEPDEWTTRLLAESGATFTYTPMSRDKHFYILQDVRRIGRQRGLTLTWPVDARPCWEVAHLAYLAAEEQGLGRLFAAQVYQARWRDGRDIHDPATIRDIGVRIGADVGALVDAVHDVTLRRRGAEALARGSRDGVFGVPLFVQGREKYWGVERLAAFVDACDAGTAGGADAAPDGAAVPTGTAPYVLAGDGGHAGGCG
nr:DsbA family protein [Planosporangium thailandense]